MVVGGGDREGAGLLSALAEAPHLSAAATLLLSRLADITGAARATMFRLEPTREQLVVTAAIGFGPGHSHAEVPSADLSNPLVIGALSLTPIRGTVSFGVHGVTSLASWVALPMAGAPIDAPSRRCRSHARWSCWHRKTCRCWPGPRVGPGPPQTGSYCSKGRFVTRRCLGRSRSFRSPARSWSASPSCRKPARSARR